MAKTEILSNNTSRDLTTKLFGNYSTIDTIEQIQPRKMNKLKHIYDWLLHKCRLV